MSALSREAVQQPARLGIRRLAGEHGLELAPRSVRVLGLYIRVGERQPRVDAVVAPDRDLQFVDRIRDLAAARVQTSEQQGAPRVPCGDR